MTEFAIKDDKNHLIYGGNRRIQTVCHKTRTMTADLWRAGKTKKEPTIWPALLIVLNLDLFNNLCCFTNSVT